MTMLIDDASEWLEADGLGGFASGTASGIRTRRYHALLLTAATPPTARRVLVNGADVWLETLQGAPSLSLSSQRYAPGVLHPDGASRIVSFTHEPWPSWEYEGPGGIRVRQEIVVEHEAGTTVMTWTLLSAAAPLRLHVRPFLSGRDYHALHHENGAFRFEPLVAGGAVTFHPYDGVPAIRALSDGEYRHAPDWYRRFLYTAEAERGLDDTEDLASPGVFIWTLSPGGPPGSLLWRACGSSSGVIEGAESLTTDDVRRLSERIRGREAERRASFATPLERAADAYLARRGQGRTIIAGYPWFTDWGRDTFVALRGVCLAAGRLDEAREILVEWAGTVSQGMLPNRFADSGETPEFNAVDASLWFVVAVGEVLSVHRRLAARDRRLLESAVTQIVSGYASGTRYGIRLAEDGLLAAGEPGQQLTWMDARVGGDVVTPRIGKPVEVQALWFNALRVAGAFESRWIAAAEAVRQRFVERFWRDDLQYLADVVDVDHLVGSTDDRFRPNQILAVGGLPHPLVEGPRARAIVDAVERRLLTPLGLRSLAPGEPGYAGRYEGGPSERDAVYHQGTVWPWLIGPFVEAWVRVRGGGPAVRREAYDRFVTPLVSHLTGAGLGHVSEIADGDPPFTPRGCPFQAWSLGELLRLQHLLLGRPGRRTAGRASMSAA